MQMAANIAAICMIIRRPGKTGSADGLPSLALELFQSISQLATRNPEQPRRMRQIAPRTLDGEIQQPGFVSLEIKSLIQKGFTESISICADDIAHAPLTIDLRAIADAFWRAPANR